MSSTQYEKQILDAIEVIVDRAIDSAGYNKTIRGIISSLEDPTIGKYKVKYQDSEIEAYSNNKDVKYSKGTLVDIMVPNGDFTQNKVILDAVDKNNVEYNTILEESEQYEIDGGNHIAATQEFGLCSYHENDIIYLYDRDEDINNINLDTIGFMESIKTNNKILCGAKFRTSFDAKQKRDGNFGIVFKLDFKDNITGAIKTKSFVIDINKMVGSPYDLLKPIRQSGIFQINNQNFDSIRSIYIFSKDFSIIDETKETNDIFVSDFELSALRSLTTEEINGYSLQINKIGKGYFNEDSKETDVVTLEAILKLKTKESTIDVNYYWFKENSQIDLSSDEYISYGGNGWECLNRFNEIDDGSRMWIATDKRFNISKTICESAATNIKCVIVKDNNIIAEDTITIYNYVPSHTISISSNQGNQFYFDNGNPTLTCLVDGAESDDYEYHWSYIDINGDSQELEETVTENIEYNTAIANYEFLKAQIESEIAMPAASQEQLNTLKATIDSYEYIQRVEKNKIYHVDLTQITEATTFKCTVEKNNRIIGTTDITIKNSLGIEGNYTLNIINGTQVFDYDFNGISPTSEIREKPIKIQPLSFEIIDNLGRSFNETFLSNCDIEWIVPKEDTLLIGEDSKELSLNYSIAENFDNNKLDNNNIKLKVQYKNLKLEAQTQFTFTKDGDPGTNGTGVVCRIIPNTTEKLEEYPMLINGVPNFTPETTGKWFKTQLWKNGVKIFEGIDSGEDVNVAWSILQNKYIKADNSAIYDYAAISVNGSTFSYNGYSSDAAAIIKVQVDYQGISYYCTLPLIIAQIEDADYSINLIKNTGFRYVMYSSDGKRPQYNNTKPFEIKVTKVIDNYIEDISTISNEHQINYDWAIRGKIFNVQQNAFIEDLHFIFAEDLNLARNQKILVPNEEYDGENVTNALEVKILTPNLTEKGRILIPLHLYLDRYGISELNGWDGNKISINDDAGSILAPQVGAGKKESDNTFTGVLIGSVKERQSDEIEQGLFGYSHGQRSIFLDAKTGNAEFGLVGAGRIILDAQSGGKIYGGNYQSGSSGMLIDLATPEIKWGNEKFKVDADGKLNATDVTLIGNITASSGKIGNWNINNGAISNNYTTLTSDGKINASEVNLSGTINATSGRIADYTINGAQLIGNNVGLSGTSGQGWAFWAGSNDPGGAPFHVGHNGEVHCSNLSITGGELNINGRFQVNSSGRLIAKTSGGGQLSMGQYTNHPYVSGLNVGSFGVDMHSAGISNCYTVANGGDLYLASTGGTVHIGHSSGGSGLAIELSGSTTYLNGTIRFVNGETVYVQTSLGYKNLGSLINAAVQHGWIS